MKVTWLGQAGLMFETDGKTIIVDPYLSNSVEKIEPHNKRRVAVDEKFLKVKPDVLVLTHNHIDHTDPETLVHYIGEDTSVVVLGPTNAYQTARGFKGIKNNYVLFNAGTRWTEGNVTFKAVSAEHSDPTAIGFVLEAEGKKYYVTGDTLYNDRILAEIPSDIDYVFIPVNGRGNNMNFADAKEFCAKIGATVIPMHCGLFDSLDMNDFDYADKIVPKFYEEIPLK